MIILVLKLPSVMILKRGLAISLLFLLALVNLHSQSKNLIILRLFNYSNSKFTPSTTKPSNTETVKEMESVDFPSLKSKNKSHSEVGYHVSSATVSKAPRASALVRKAANATRNQDIHLPVPVAAVDDSPPLVISMPSNPKLYFIHVGKAGGLTLNLILDTDGTWQALDCFMDRSQQAEKQTQLKHQTNASGSAPSPPCYVPSPEYPSQLSQHLVSFLHLFGARFSKLQRQWILDHTDTFLFLLRDPVDRLVSAYNFHRHNFAKTRNPAHKLFYHVCFPNGMEDLLNQVSSRYHENHGGGGGGEDTKNATQCQSIGFRALRGEKYGKYESGAGNHFVFDYRYYASQTIHRSRNHSVAVVRTEHMWNDIIVLDKRLGGTGNFSLSGTKVSHGSENWQGGEKYNAYLSRKNLQHLCCFMFEELEVYQQLVLLAANLDHEQKRVTLTSTLMHCQIEYAGDPVSQPFPWLAYYKTICLPMIEDFLTVVA